jgi:inhibitor of Bruton tyrosine kinase
MKAIMAEAETSKASTRPVTLSSTVAGPSASRPPAASDTSNWRAPQRKPSASALPDALPRTAPGASPSGSPWKSVPAVPSMTNLGGPSPVPTPPMTPQMRATRSRDEVPNPGSGSGSKTPQRAGMGPVFTPARQVVPKSTSSPAIRRASSNMSAWTLPPVQPSVQPAMSSAPPSTPPRSGGMSFVAIQELQRELEASAGGGRDKKRSLKEIQEEEQARQVEEDFLRWWADEEERLRLEQAPPEALAVQTGKKGKGRKRGEGAGDGSQSSVQAGKSGRREGGPRKEGGKRDGVKRDGAPKDASKVEHGGPAATPGSTAEGSSTPNTPRRRRRPGPGVGAGPQRDSRSEVKIDGS